MKFKFCFIVFPFMYKQTQKNGKTKNDFRFIVFPFMYEKTQKRKNKNRFPFYRFLVFERTDTKKGKT